MPPAPELLADAPPAPLLDELLCAPEVCAPVTGPPPLDPEEVVDLEEKSLSSPAPPQPGPEATSTVKLDARSAPMQERQLNRHVLFMMSFSSGLDSKSVTRSTLLRS